MTQRFVLSHFLAILGVQALIRKLKETTFDIKFHLIDWFSIRCVRVQVEGGGGEVH